MISCEKFAESCLSLGLKNATGVPDSTFKGFISYVTWSGRFSHIIASNECEAMGIAAGIYLAEGKPALVYMQNSGFGKTVNPYTSLFAKEIYSIPAVLLVGWRGKPGIKDEPQHSMMGRVMLPLMKDLDLPYTILDENTWEKDLTECYNMAVNESRPCALVVSPDLFEDYRQTDGRVSKNTLKREDALKVIVDELGEKAAFISTTGKASRELFELRKNAGKQDHADFYTVGSMGCASSIGLGVALSSPGKQVVVIDGDGATLMQMGTLATIGSRKVPNLLHIVIDNNAHDSTGGQPTVSDSVDFAEVAKACGYSEAYTVDNEKMLRELLVKTRNAPSLKMIVIKCKAGSRADLGRPTKTPQENKEIFMNCLRNVQGSHVPNS